MRASPSRTRPGVYPSSKRRFSFCFSSTLFALGLILWAITSAPLNAQTAGQNVNMVSGTGWTNGDPFLERQNEPSMAVSTRNSSHLFGAANDYRSVDLPGLLGIDERGDAWLGIYKSFDGGLTWQSTLLPGFPLDGSPEGLASPIHGRQASADPLVRAGSNGLLFLTGVAFDRGTGPLSKVFISRFIDLNNKENGDAAAANGSLTNLAPRDPVKYIDTRVIDSGTPTRFLDKPWVAVDIPRGRATCTITANEDGNSVTQKIPAGAIYVTYTAFTTVGTVTNSQILFRRSTDCGVTWSKPIVLSQGEDRPGAKDRDDEQEAEGQGTVIAIDPSVPADQPAKIYVAWRVFAEPGDPDEGNEIRMASSSDGGLTFDQQDAAVEFPLSCNKKPTGVGCPFDQSETGTSFRSNGYPALTVDNAGRVYLAWSQRDRNGDGRITMTVMDRVESCPSSRFKEIDTGPVYDDYGNPFSNLSNRGSQLMPTLNFNQGKLLLTYYDLRQDHTSGLLTPTAEPTCDPAITPLCPIGNPFSELRHLEGELVTNPMAVFGAYVDDSTLTVRRHTLDIIGSEAEPNPFSWSLDVPSFTHFRVSRYEYGVIPPDTDIEQAQFNAPNLPMFVQGTAPFMGDYIDVAGAPSMVPDNGSNNRHDHGGWWERWDGRDGSSNSGGWKFNTEPTSNPVFHATWTDNRDVQPPPDGVSWNRYTPPISASIGSTSKFDPTQTPPPCVAGYSGMRNQNVYTSAISHGLILTSPQTAKPVLQANGQPIPREFSLVMRNDTNESRQFQLSIPAQPASAQASFLQFSLQNTLTVNIPAFSSASRPVFLTPGANSTVIFPSFEVGAKETDGATPPLTASILFNADPTNPVLANPDNAAFGSGTISSQEFYNPAILNPAILNPAILNPAILNPAILNPAILNPAILNPAILNPAILNPNFVVALNPAILNPAILNPAILNNAVANPAILNPAILNTPVSDANYTITNEGNTSATYQLQLFQSGPLPASAVFQIILTKTYLTPGVSPTDGCTYGGQVNNEVIASIDNPVFVTDPTQLGNPAILNPAINNPTFSIAPGDTVQITLRANLTVPELANVVLPNLTPVVAAQAVNTVDVQKGSTTPPIALLITTAALPAAMTGQAYSTALAAIGGNAPVSADVWSIAGGALPTGLNLSAAGVISGTPTAAGTFTFVVQVTDTGTPQHVASRQFSITAIGPLAITTPAPVLAPGTAGALYVLTFAAAGGVLPYTWTGTGALPPGLTLAPNGLLSGVPTAAGTYNFTAQATDSSVPAQIATQTFSLVIAAAGTGQTGLTFTSNSVPAVVVGRPYSQQLPVVGGTLPYTATLTNGTLPPGITLSSGGVLGGTASGQGTFTFSTSVTDSSVPPQTATQAMTISVNTLVITTTVLPGGIVGVPYSAPIATAGGTLPLSFSVATAAFPPGLTIQQPGPTSAAGALAGTPTLIGTYTFSESVVDSSATQQTATQNYVVTIAPAGTPAPAIVAFVSQPQNSIGGQAITGSPIVVKVTDANNTPVVGSSVALNFNGAPPCAAAVLGGTLSVVTDTTGQATFSNLSIDRGQLGYALLASTGSASTVSQPFTVNGFCPTQGTIGIPREAHTSVTLANGTVLIAGGGSRLAGVSSPGLPFNSTELYNPATHSFSTAGNMNVPRWGHTATLLLDGRVLITGGVNSTSTEAGSVANTAEIYDPTEQTFVLTAGTMSSPRFLHTATLLADGRVLIVGGGTTVQPACILCYGATISNTAEIFDPATGLFTPTTAPMATARQVFTSTLLPDGEVLVAGGAAVDGTSLSAAELFDPLSNGFHSTASLTVPRSFQAAALLPSGKVLLAGGNSATSTTPSAELYDPIAGTFTAAGNLAIGLGAFLPTVLADGTVLLPGGNGIAPTNFSEIYSPTNGAFTATGGLDTPNLLYASALLPDGTVLITGGENGSETIADAEIYYSTAPLAPLTVTTASVPSGLVGQGYTQFLLEQGGLGTLTWSLASGSLPPGISLSSTPTGGLLFGTPAAAGTFTFTLSLTDSSEKSATSGPFTLVIDSVTAALSFPAPNLNTAIVGAPYTASLTITGGTTPYNLAVTTGTLPPGITLGTNGQFSGAPTTAGTFTFTVTVTDSSTPTQTATQTVTIVVVSPLAILTTTLSGGTVGTPYSTAILTTGGKGTATVNVTAGALPTGLTLTPFGVLGGTPSTAATFTFTVTATDQSFPAQLASKSYTVTIVPVVQIPANVAFAVQPQASIEGQPLTNSPIQVFVTDATNTPIANTSVNMVLTQTPPCSTAALAGTIPQITNASGVASFPDLTINRGQAGFSLLATASNVTGTSGLFNVEGYCDTASMAVARHSHQVVALANGKVLVAGGAVNPDGSGALASAELYDPATHTFSTVGSMSTPRVDFTTTLLPNGKVLVTGGFNDTTVNSSAELFDPITNTFTLLANAMTTSRSEHVATLLVSGTVLITGGNDVNGNTLASAEIFDPGTSTFTAATHAMTAARQIHHADLLANGQALIEGGFDANNNALVSAELYNPVGGTFTATGSMTTGRGNHASALLYNGQVLVAGGLAGPGTALAPTATAELYNPATGTFTPTASMSVARGHYTTVTLEDGTVFIQGGATLPAGTNADIFNPATGTFRVTGNFTTEQAGMREGPLPDGTVLLASGLNSSTVVVPNSELFYPLTLPTTITVTTSSLPNALVSQPYTQLLLQKGGAGALTWTLSNGTLPTGVTLSSAGILTGTPTAAGTFSFSLNVADSASPQKTGTSGTLTLEVSSDLTFALQTPPTAIAGTGYSDALVATGGTPPYTFAQTSGTLPAGITLSSAGLLTGSTTATGTFTIGVTVTDSSVPVQTASQTLTLLVVAPLVITTTTLPNGTQGTAYSATINTTGGQGTVGQSVTSGALPTGFILSASGALSGTPSAAGTFTFTVTATDQDSPPQVASQFYSILIAPAVQVPGNVTFVTSPQNSIEGQVLAGSPVQVLVTDATNTPVPNAAVSIGFSGPPPCAAATLGGTLTQTTDATGTATFGDLSINRGQFGFTLAATTGTFSAVSNAFNVEGFCVTGSLATARVLHSVVALPNGTVLVAGGAPTSTGANALSSAELYNPATQSFTTIGSMNSARAAFTMTVLQNGLVLVAGGLNGSTVLSSAELFDPSTNTFTLLTASLVVARSQHFATLLPTGEVLITGGSSSAGSSLASAEVFDPATKTFTATAGPMTVARSGHHADVLSNGQVLVTGGLASGIDVLASAEFYDPVANTFTATGSMATARYNHGSALLFNGNVLVAGGNTSNGEELVSIAAAETYNPSTGTFSSTGSATRPISGFYHPVPVLSDGTVFLADGNTNAEIYDPTAGTFRATGNMVAVQVQPQTALLPNGTVVLAGGQDSTGTGVANGEVFYPINIIPISITTVLPTALVNVSYTQQLQEKGGVGALTWTVATGTLPTGLTLSTSGLLSGTPTTAGASLFTVQVADSSVPPRTSTASFAVAVVPPLTVLPFLPTANPGVAYSQPLLVGGGATPYTFTITAGALPTGLTLSSGVVSGTTTNVGSFSITVQVTDSSTPRVSVTQVVGITVAQPVTITTASLPGGTLGAPYSAQIVATGGAGSVSVGVISGALPTGLRLSPQGALNGTPSAAASFTFTVAAVDSSADPQIAQQTYTVAIAPAVAALVLGPASLAAPTVGVAYSQNFTVSGGVAPYTVTQTGALPTGLSFNGTVDPPTISGTPTLVGTFANIVVTATDSLGTQAQVTYTMTVNAFNASCGTGSESLFNGQYAILMQGFDANGPRTLIGSIAANGAGGIPSGQIDIGTDLPTGGGAAQHLSIIPAQSSFSVGSDQRGCLVLTTSAGSSSYRFSLGGIRSGASTLGHIIDFQLNGTYGTGFLKLQTPAVLSSATLDGSYAFFFSTASSLSSVGHWAMLGSFSASGGAVSTGSWDYNDTQTIDGGTTWPASGLQFPAGGSYAFDATGRGTVQLPSVQQYSQTSTLASANVVIYPTDGSDFFVAVLPDANNKPLVGEIEQQNEPFSSLALNGAGYVDGVTAPPISAGAWVASFSASQNAWNISLDNDFAGTYTAAPSNGTLTVDSTGRAPLAYTGSTTPAPMLRVVTPSEVYFMLSDGAASVGIVHGFPGGIPPATIAGSYSFGASQGTIDRNATNLVGTVVFDSAGNVTFTQDQAAGSTSTLTPGATVTSTYSYNATTGRGVIPATGAPHYVFDSIFSGGLYLLDVTSVNPQAMELDAFAPPAVTLFPDPLDLIVGGTGTMSVVLGSPAGGDGQVVALTSSNSTIASVPSSVTVPAGVSSTNFTVTAGANSGSVDITASVAGLPVTNAAVVVSPLTMTVSPDSPLLAVNRSFNATVTLVQPAGPNGLTVTLTATPTGVVTISPASQTIAAGQTTAVFSLAAGATAGSTTLTATAPGYLTATAPITVTTNAISFGTIPVLGPGQSSSLPVSLSFAAPTGGLTINFTSSNTAVASVTQSVFVPAGLLIPSANPQVTGAAIGSAQINATATGFAPDTANVTVTVTDSLNPNSISVNATLSTNVTITISAAAPAGGITFNLSSDNAAVATVPATATVAQGQLTVTFPVTGVAQGSANLSVSSTGITTITAPINVGAAPAISLNSTIAGNNTVTPGSASLSVAVPSTPANPTITLTSGDPTHFLLTADPTKVGTVSITLALTPGSGSVPTFYIEGQNYTGTTAITATLTASSAGYTSATSTLTLYPTGITYWPGGSGTITTTTFSSPTTITVYLVLLSPGTLNAYTYSYPLGPQAPAPIPVAITSTNTTFGTVTGSPATIGVGTYYTQAISFVPGAAGTTDLNIATPAGYFTPANVPVQSVATVSTPTINFNIPIVGNNLVEQGGISLGAATPSTPANPTITLTSGDATHFSLTSDPTKVGTASITLPLTPGSTSVPVFYVEGQNYSGSTAITATLTATSSGYANGTFTMTLYPTGVSYWPGGSSAVSTTTFSSPTTLTMYLVTLSPGTLNAYTYGYSLGPQAPGAIPISVTDTNTAVATLTGNPSTIPIGSYFTQAISVVPVAAGTANVNIATPNGYFTPANIPEQSVVTVTAPSINLSIPVIGNNLVEQGGISLGTATPSTPANPTLTLTSSDPTHFLLTADPTKVGTASITLPLTPGSAGVPTFYIEGQNYSGTAAITAMLTASSTGYTTATSPLTLYPTGLSYWPGSGGAIATTTFSPASTLTVYLVLLAPGTLNAYTYGYPLGPQAPGAITVSLTDTNIAVGTLTGNPSAIGVGTYFTQAINFVPATAGTTNLTIATPAGYVTPANVPVTTVATVTAPAISLNVPVIGNNLVEQGSISLPAAPPSNETLTLTSTDASHFLLTTDPTKVGTASITLPLTAGNASVPAFYIEGQNFSGAGAVTATLTASAAGYSDGIFTLTLYPTGLSFWPGSGGTLSTSATSGPSTVTVYLVLLTPGTLNAYNYGYPLGPQAPGGAVQVSVVSTNTAVGTITGGPAAIPVGIYYTQALSFTPAATGTTNLSLSEPSGYYLPANVPVQIVATVQ